MGGRGPWSPFTLVSARLVLVVVLVIDGLACVVGDDGAQASMYADGGGGCCRSSVVVVGSTSPFANARSRSWILMVGGCRLVGGRASVGSWWAVVIRGRLW